MTGMPMAEAGPHVAGGRRSLALGLYRVGGGEQAAGNLDPGGLRLGFGQNTARDILIDLAQLGAIGLCVIGRARFRHRPTAQERQSNGKGGNEGQGTGENNEHGGRLLQN
jgi:hypothetical protein